jgi:prepilin peptidase CpaA
MQGWFIAVEKYFLICALGTTAVAAVTDVRGSRIPNWLTYTGLLLALAARAAFGWPALKDGLLGMFIGGGLFLVLFVVGGMGGGDVKLMAAVGAWAGQSNVAVIMIATAISGGFLALGYMFTGKIIRRTLWNTVELVRHHLTSGLQPHPFLNIHESGSLRVPFGLAIAMGTFYCTGSLLWWR